MHWPRGQNVKGQDHMVTKTVAVNSDHGQYFVNLYAAVCPHVDTTAYVFQLWLIFIYVQRHQYPRWRHSRE